MDAALAFLDGRDEAMVEQLTRLAVINSYSFNLPGLTAVATALREMFAELSPDWSQSITLPPMETLAASAELLHSPLGQLLSFRKRPQAPLQVLLVIHYDTVYAPDHPFQSVTEPDAVTLRGPGVADAKGGIVVMLNALLAFEQSPAAANVGWHVVLNSDEEIGSPGSASLLVDAARTADVALVFEPAPTHDAMVTQRKGSGNYSAVFRGRSAHAGREIEKGRNAILAAARFASDATAAVSAIPGATINVGKIDGGGPVNVVPDLAIARLNCRAVTPDQPAEIERRLAALIAAANVDGITAEFHGHFSSPPWVMSDDGLAMFAQLQSAARGLGLEIRPTSSGGASDANKIASAGIPVLDSLGPVGADIHSADERVFVPTLVERAKLVASFLIALGESTL